MYQCINVGFRLQNCGDTGLPIKHVIKHAGCARDISLLYLGHTKLICCCSGPTYPKFSKSKKKEVF